MARPTTDKKDNTIKLRVNDILREQIQLYANRNGVSMSEYIRIVLEKHFRDKLPR